jgi:hypothetical protein
LSALHEITRAGAAKLAKGEISHVHCLGISQAPLRLRLRLRRRLKNPHDISKVRFLLEWLFSHASKLTTCHDSKQQQHMTATSFAFGTSVGRANRMLNCHCKRRDRPNLNCGARMGDFVGEKLPNKVLRAAPPGCWCWRVLVEFQWLIS